MANYQGLTKDGLGGAIASQFTEVFEFINNYIVNCFSYLYGGGLYL